MSAGMVAYQCSCCSYRGASLVEHDAQCPFPVLPQLESARRYTEAPERAALNYEPETHTGQHGYYCEECHEIDDLARVAAAVAEERERCARECDRIATDSRMGQYACPCEDCRAMRLEDTQVLLSLSRSAREAEREACAATVAALRAPLADPALSLEENSAWTRGFGFAVELARDTIRARGEA